MGGLDDPGTGSKLLTLTVKVTYPGQVKASEITAAGSTLVDTTKMGENSTSNDIPFNVMRVKDAYGPCCENYVYVNPLDKTTVVQEPKYCAASKGSEMRHDDDASSSAASAAAFFCAHGHAVGGCLQDGDKTTKYTPVEAKSFEDYGICCVDQSQDPNYGLLVLQIFAIIYLFCGIAIVCDDFFTASLEKLSIRFQLSEDVAGATFMAAGSSAPELFTSLMASLGAAGVSCDNRGAVGVGTIVGSAIFNILIIIGATALLAGQVLQLGWKPLVRDTCFYAGSIILLFLTLLEQDSAGQGNALVERWEGLVLVSGYVAYIIFMKFNARICGDDTSAPVIDESVEDRIRRASVPDESTETTNLTDGDKKGDDIEGGGTGETKVEKADNAEEKKEGEEEDDGETDCLGFEVPEDRGGKIFFYFSYPWYILFKITIPNCEEERWEKWYVVSFINSIIWIGAICFGMVEFCVAVGEQLEVSSAVMGLTVLSAGTSVPDALSSIMVAQRGLGDMAVSNALGSNVFDILLGLGFPYFISNIKHFAEGCSDDVEDPRQECAVKMCVKDVAVFMYCLAIVLALVIGSFAVAKFRLRPALGGVLIALYVVFFVFAYVRDQVPEFALSLSSSGTCAAGGH